jgi:hypothetical protein
LTKLAAKFGLSSTAGAAGGVTRGGGALRDGAGASAVRGFLFEGPACACVALPRSGDASAGRFVLDADMTAANAVRLGLILSGSEGGPSARSTSWASVFRFASAGVLLDTRRTADGGGGGGAGAVGPSRKTD